MNRCNTSQRVPDVGADSNDDWNTDSTAARRASRRASGRRHGKNRSRNSGSSKGSSSSKNNSSKSSRSSQGSSKNREFNRGYTKPALKKKTKSVHRSHSSASASNDINANQIPHHRSSKRVQFGKPPIKDENRVGSVPSVLTPYHSRNPAQAALVKSLLPRGGSETSLNACSQPLPSKAEIRKCSTADLNRLCYLILSELYQRQVEYEERSCGKSSPLPKFGNENVGHYSPQGKSSPRQDYGSSKAQYKTPSHLGSGKRLPLGISARWQASHPGWQDGRYLFEGCRWQYISPKANDQASKSNPCYEKNEQFCQKTPSRIAEPSRAFGTLKSIPPKIAKPSRAFGTLIYGDKLDVKSSPSSTPSSPLVVYESPSEEYSYRGFRRT